MNIFISWSGKRSKEIGELLDNWLSCVIQAVNPWMSSKDIDRGSLWFSEINDQLKNTSIGIVCLTSSNLNKPWILFEAGALAKGLSSSRVCTFLIDIVPSDISDPLAQFNHTLPTREDMWKLVSTINNALEDKKLSSSVLVNAFETYWPQFETRFNQILSETTDDIIVIERKEDDKLNEILDMTRRLDKRMRSIEDQQKFVGTEKTLSLNKYIDWITSTDSEKAFIIDEKLKLENESGFMNNEGVWIKLNNSSDDNALNYFLKKNKNVKEEK